MNLKMTPRTATTQVVLVDEANDSVLDRVVAHLIDNDRRVVTYRRLSNGRWLEFDSEHPRRVVKHADAQRVSEDIDEAVERCFEGVILVADLEGLVESKLFMVQLRDITPMVYLDQPAAYRKILAAILPEFEP